MTHKVSKPSCLVLPLIVILSMAFSNAALAGQPPVAVKTYGQHIGGNIVYTHQVTNNGDRNVVGIAISVDTDQVSPNLPYDKLQGELNFVMPVGSEMCSPEINPALISGPTGWTAQIVPIEHSGCYLQWNSPGYPQPPIQSGQTLRFSITVPKYFEAYLTGHFSASYADGKEPWYYNGVMEKLDTAPPILSFTLNPNIIRPNERLVPITAAITVKDDYDPAPEIKLESITPSEPAGRDDIRDASLGTDDRQFVLKAEREGKNKAGRVYTVIYSAIDASGNQATASATVTVPHDERVR